MANELCNTSVIDAEQHNKHLKGMEAEIQKLEEIILNQCDDA
jgi:hypothetical protein